MKINNIITSTMQVPNNPPVSEYYAYNTYVTARIQTDEGIEGLGYTMLVGGFGAQSVRAYMEESLLPLLIGEEPRDINRLWQLMYENDRGVRKKGIPMYAISAIDIGLWDILAKQMNQPVWRLLGAHTDSIAVYGSGGFLPYSIDEIISEAEKFISLGCKHYKFKLGRPILKENITRVREVRKALGNDIEILVDANQRWDVATNIRVANQLEDYELYWYEEPVLADNIKQCAEVAKAISTPVATGENEYTRYGFRDIIDQKAASFLNPDIHRCGGFSEMIKISHLAAAYDIKIAPHLVPELSIHTLVSTPNAALVEFLAGSPDDLWQNPPLIVDGMMSPPNRIGHGMEFSDEAIKRYTIFN